MPRTWLEVSLDQIRTNYRLIARTVGAQIAVMPVVKADAYRHGSIAVSQTLEHEGAGWLAVSNIDEGKMLREAGVRARILVMADRVSTDARAWAEYRLTPAIHDLEEIRELPPGHAYHLKVDTGMHRLGTLAAAQEILEATRGTNLEGLMTHFASSADYTSDQTSRQMAAFAALQQQLQPRYVHAASTNPLHFARREAWGNLVRPGYAIYGYVSAAKGKAPEELLSVAPALRWKATILLTKEIPAGSPVGYGAQYVTQRPARIGILGVGYADGYPHRLSNKGQVIAAGRLVPVLGAVSMDVTTVDLTDAPQLQAGDAVTLMGAEGSVSLDARQIARQAGTIAYAVLCGISTRVPRYYE
jgi:alanine racemase